jgi:ribosomal protein S18 acetylase RimI-like enzyme
LIFYQVHKSDYDKFGVQFAGIHFEGYPKNHLTANFSKKKLMEYYHCLVDASDVTVIALEDDEAGPEGILDGKMLGFIIAGKEVSEGINRFLRKNRFYVLSVMMRHPVFILEKAQSLLSSRPVKKIPSKANFRLLSICVATNAFLGTGRGMLEFFEDILRSRRIKCYGLSVRKSNARAIAFYEKNGFVFEGKSAGSLYYTKELILI